jgi:hypothetical protein
MKNPSFRQGWLNNGDYRDCRPEASSFRHGCRNPASKDGKASAYVDAKSNTFVASKLPSKAKDFGTHAEMTMAETSC